MSLSRPLVIRICSALFTFVTIISYQNCGVNYSTNQKDFVSRKATALDNDSNFIYEASFDQIAYLSCAEQDNIINDEGVFFSLKAGAYRNGSGLRIKPSFFEEFKKQTLEEKVDIVNESELNSNMQMQFSLRYREGMQLATIDGGPKQGILGREYSNRFGVLGTDTMSSALLNMPSGEYMRYWKAAGIDKDANFEGYVTYNDSDSLAKSVRSALSGGMVLSLGYSEVLDKSLLRAPDSSGQSVYGTAINMNFKKPTTSWFFQKVRSQTTPIFKFDSVNISMNFPARIASSVSEIQTVAGGEMGGTWSCPQNMVFMVVQPEVVNEKPTFCQRKSDSDFSIYTSNPGFVKSVRYSLKESDWYIDWENNCIVPKKYQVGSCYGRHSTTGDSRRVEYDISRDCSEDKEVITNGVLTKKVCPHFASICVRSLQ